jgi:hypothetical protein
MPSRRERKLAGGGGRFVVIAAEDETPGREDPTPGLGRHGKAGDQFPDTTQRQHGPGPRDEVKCSSVRAEPLPGAVSQFPPRRGQPVRSQLLVGTNGERCRRRPLLLHDWSRSPATAGRRPPRAGTDDEKQSDPVGAPHRKLTAPSVDGSALSRAHRMQPHTLARMSVGAVVAVGAVLGLALGIVVGVTTDLPLAPEGGVVLGALLGWLWRRTRT